MAADAPPAKAKELRSAAAIWAFDAHDVLRHLSRRPKRRRSADQRIKQAAAAGIPHVLTFGHTSGNNRQVWVERFKQLGPIARDHGVMIVVKQHGETGQVTGEIVREVADEGIKVNYDAGNVMDYTKGQVNPLDDIKTCAELIRSFCIKDHRMFP